jgi:hypothetical protein
MTTTGRQRSLAAGGHTRRYQSKAHVVDNSSDNYVRTIRFSVSADSRVEAIEKAHKKLERRRITNYILSI